MLSENITNPNVIFMTGQLVQYYQHHERSVKIHRILLVSQPQGALVFVADYATATGNAGFALFSERKTTARPVPETDANRLGCFKKGDLWGYDLEAEAPASVSDAASLAQSMVAALGDNQIIWNQPTAVWHA